MSNTQKPSIGRRLLVKLNGQHRLFDVTDVNADGTVDGLVLDAKSPLGMVRPLLNVAEGDGENQWSWPPRV